jgi:hypothetical protein
VLAASLTGFLHLAASRERLWPGSLAALEVAKILALFLRFRKTGSRRTTSTTLIVIKYGRLHGRYNVCPTDPVDTIIERDGKSFRNRIKFGDCAER